MRNSFMLALAIFAALTLRANDALSQSPANESGVPSGPSATQNDKELIELLIRKSPWDGRVESWSYRTSFSRKGEALVAHVLAFYSNARADSPVRLKDGEVNWQHPSGADITVRLDDKGQLVGTALARGSTYRVVYKSTR